MSNEWFRFKKFLVRQDQSSMKVGTDSVLLGAWTDIDNCKDILDIGSGTGIIALMCAQRSNANITGVEIDPLAASQATENFAASPWKDRLKVIQADIRDKIFTNHGFDVIVSNPPYFKSSLLSQVEGRNRARHETTLSLEELVETVLPLMKKNGRISLILPQDRFTLADNLFAKEDLFLRRKTEVSSRPGSGTLRVLAEWTGFKQEPIITHLHIYKTDSNEYHPEFWELTESFYL